MAKLSGAATVLFAITAVTGGLFALSEFIAAAPGDAVIPAIGPDPTTSSTEPATTTAPTTTTTTTDATLTPTTVLVATPTAATTSSTNVGAGGVITFDGMCDTVGPVFVQIIGPTAKTVDTGELGPGWSYDWTAPTDEAEFGTFAFRFFCGDPADFTDVYPAELEQFVDMVAIAAPPTTLPVASEGPVVSSVLPETD